LAQIHQRENCNRDGRTFVHSPRHRKSDRGHDETGQAGCEPKALGLGSLRGRSHLFG
jgi:hypothetical protein